MSLKIIGLKVPLLTFRDMSLGDWFLAKGRIHVRILDDDSGPSHPRSQVLEIETGRPYFMAPETPVELLDVTLTYELK